MSQNRRDLCPNCLNSLVSERVMDQFLIFQLFGPMASWESVLRAELGKRWVFPQNQHCWEFLRVLWALREIGRKCMGPLQQTMSL